MAKKKTPKPKTYGQLARAQGITSRRGGNKVTKSEIKKARRTLGSN